MKYTLTILLSCIITFTQSGKKVIPMTCTQRRGDKVYGAGDVSKVACSGKGEVLVSCGIDGWHSVGGTKVRPSNDNLCTASLSSTAGAAPGVAAVANCCRFPKAAQAQGIARISKTTSREEEASCGPKSELTGCTVSYESGTFNNIKGSYAGNALRKDERKTKNTCTGTARSDATTVKAGAQCVKLDNPKYELDCVAVTKYTTQYGLTQSNSCPRKYQLLSCMTYSTTLTLDDWFITGQNRGIGCYVQQDNWANMYANGVCCKLTKNVRGYDDEDEDEEEWVKEVEYDDDDEDEEEMEMFVPVNNEIVTQDSYYIESMAAIVCLLLIGFGIYKYCYGHSNGGYKTVATNDYGTLTTV